MANKYENYNSKENADKLIELVNKAFDSYDFRDSQGMSGDNLIVEALSTDVSYLAHCVAQDLNGTNGRSYPYDREEIIEHINSECGIAA